MISSPRWTDLDVMKWILGTVAGLMVAVTTVIWRLFAYWNRKKHQTLLQEAEVDRQRAELAARKEQEALAERDQFKDQLQQLDADLQTQRHPALSQMQRKMTAFHAGLAQLQQAKSLTEDKLDQAHLDLAELYAEVESDARQLIEHEKREKAQRNRMARALKLEGQIWNARVPCNAPRFRPLSQRRTPILSILNLKGGVGKTTLTANLGAQFADLGLRPLLLDLDLQGSLTNLFIEDEKHRSLFDTRLLLQNYLDQAIETHKADLRDYIQHLENRSLSLLPTADTLAYTEINLTFKWLLRLARRDARFLLRRALQQNRVTKRHDIILMDCPPLLNVSCVNALAASDYVLIPVMPSAQVTNRVPPFLLHLKAFRANLNPDLKVLGIVANRTQRTELTSDEATRWGNLRDLCKDSWGEEIYLFERNIRQNTEIRKNEDARRPLEKSDEMYPAFRELAEEVLSRLPSATRRHSPSKVAQTA
jgi:cellulose biosynthesis protein BcsQ